jgi:hypothetical protein
MGRGYLAPDAGCQQPAAVRVSVVAQAFPIEQRQDVDFGGSG